MCCRLALSFCAAGQGWQSPGDRQRPPPGLKSDTTSVKGLFARQSEQSQAIGGTTCRQIRGRSLQPVLSLAAPAEKQYKEHNTMKKHECQ